MHARPFLRTTLTGLALLAPAAAQHVIHEEVGSAGLGVPIGVDDGAISPDGHWLVLRDNTVSTSARVIDLWNPGPPVVHSAAFGLGGQGAYDAVVVTDQRAAVIGTGLMLIDLTQPQAPLVLTHPVGDLPHDLAVSEASGTLCVRGGTGPTGGGYVFDLTTGAPLLHLPGELPFVNDPDLFLASDSVVAGDRYAAFLSEVSLAGNPRTRVQVVDLDPPGGGLPVMVFQTFGVTDLPGRPMDVALAPGEGFVAVRSEFALARIGLVGGSASLNWTVDLSSSSGPQSATFVDCLEVTDDLVVSIGTWVNGASTVVDVVDAGGVHWWVWKAGTPHDLALTSDGERALVRTKGRVLRFDLGTRPAGGGWFEPSANDTFGTDWTGYQAGLDSIVADDRHAVALARTADQVRVRVYDLTAPGLEREGTFVLDSPGVDLELSASGDHAIVGCLTRMAVLDLRLPAVVLDHPLVSEGHFGWSDGVAMGPGVAAAFGYGPTLFTQALVGWDAAVDLFEDPIELCGGAVNSTGGSGNLVVSGSARASANDLVLWATDVPADEFGAFRYGDQAVNLPFGDGTWCVGGQSVFFPRASTGDGTVSLTVDANALPPGGGALVAGTTWHFQYAYRDHGLPTGAGFNATSAVTVTIEP